MQRIIADPAELAQSLESIEAQSWADLLDAAPPGTAERLRIAAVRTGSAVAGSAATDSLMFNRVVGLGLGDLASESRVDELLAHYAAADVARWMIQWCPAAMPASAPELLRACGFQHHDSSVKLYRNAAAPLPAHTTDLRIARVGGEHADDFARTLARAFKWTEDLAVWCATVLDRPGWRAFMAFDDVTPVATGVVFIHGRSAWLGLGATSVLHRRRGAHTALLATRIAAARDLGAQLIVAETAEERTGRPAAALHNLQRLGFTAVYTRPHYVLNADARATGIVGEIR